MRILDCDNDRKLDEVLLFLTLSEARELRDSLKQLIESPMGNHSHISNEDFQKEITVCIYDEKKLVGFSERFKKLILEDR